MRRSGCGCLRGAWTARRVESLRMRVWLGSAQARRRRLGSVRPYATPGARRPASPCSAKVRRPPARARPASAPPPHPPRTELWRVALPVLDNSNTPQLCGPAGLRASGRRPGDGAGLSPRPSSPTAVAPGRCGRTSQPRTRRSDARRSSARTSRRPTGRSPPPPPPPPPSPSPTTRSSRTSRRSRAATPATGRSSRADPATSRTRRGSTATP